MISALLKATTPPASRLTLGLLLCVFVAGLSSASDNSIQPSSASPQIEFSADDFDWREIVPYLLVASTLPGEQGIKAVLEHSKVLRAYVASEVRAECDADKNRCAASADGLVAGEVNKRIDQIVQEGILHRHRQATVEYQLEHQPFPFSEIAAVKSDKQPQAYLILQFADHSYTAAQLQAKYGAPYDTDIYQWYSVFKYRSDNPRYSSKAVFEVDPRDGAVLKVAISLKAKSSR
jgi:hypothetical protein